jgi:hypothetical protein
MRVSDFVGVRVGRDIVEQTVNSGKVVLRGS